MGATEIVLIVLGCIVFVLSFIIPAKKEKLREKALEAIKKLTAKIKKK